MLSRLLASHRMRILKTSSYVFALAALLLATPLSRAQSAGQPLLWGHSGLEFMVFPTAGVGASLPLGRVDLRAQVGAVYTRVMPGTDGTTPVQLNVDALYTWKAGDRVWYAGPGAGLSSKTLLGSATAGVRGEYGSGPFGWFMEARLRGWIERQRPAVLPTVHVGVTYRF